MPPPSVGPEGDDLIGSHAGDVVGASGPCLEPAEHEVGGSQEALVCEALVPMEQPVRPKPALSERLFSTPGLLKYILPQAVGCSLSMDQVACRWRARVSGITLPSVGFGPHSGLNRRESLEQALDLMWAHATEPRPDWATIDSVPWEAWQGILDVRVEQPRKYTR